MKVVLLEEFNWQTQQTTPIKLCKEEDFIECMLSLSLNFTMEELDKLASGDTVVRKDHYFDYLYSIKFLELWTPDK